MRYFFAVLGGIVAGVVGFAAWLMWVFRDVMK
jgi:hypothetical protein